MKHSITNTVNTQGLTIYQQTIRANLILYFYKNNQNESFIRHARFSFQSMLQQEKPFVCVDTEASLNT